jgi:hypothetical protein
MKVKSYLFLMLKGFGGQKFSFKQSGALKMT